MISASAEYGRIFGLSLVNNGRGLGNEVLDSLIHPDDLAAVNDIYAHGERTGEAYKIEYRIRRADGEIRNVVERGVPVFMRDGRFLQQFATVQDVTESKLLEAELDEAQRISNVGSYRTDFVNNRLISFSPQLAKIYGLRC